MKFVLNFLHVTVILISKMVVVFNKEAKIRRNSGGTGYETRYGVYWFHLMKCLLFKENQQIIFTLDMNRELSSSWFVVCSPMYCLNAIWNFLIQFRSQNLLAEKIHSNISPMLFHMNAFTEHNKLCNLCSSAGWSKPYYCAEKWGKENLQSHIILISYVTFHLYIPLTVCLTPSSFSGSLVMLRFTRMIKKFSELELFH